MKTYAAFGEQNLLAEGALQDVVLAIWEWTQQGGRQEALLLDDDTGQTIDLDYRGEPADVLAQLASHSQLLPPQKPTKKGPGRPRLGVVCKEVSLLPRHWEWLAAQPRSASAALRQLIEVQMKSADRSDFRRRKKEALYRLMSTLAGDCNDFEEAARALFADEELEPHMKMWPSDIRDYILKRWGADA